MSLVVEVVPTHQLFLNPNYKSQRYLVPTDNNDLEHGQDFLRHTEMKSSIVLSIRQKKQI